MDHERLLVSREAHDFEGVEIANNVIQHDRPLRDGEDSVLKPRNPPLQRHPVHPPSPARIFHAIARNGNLCHVVIQNTTAGRAVAAPIGRLQARSKRSRFITLAQAATKSFTNFSLASELP